MQDERKDPRWDGMPDAYKIALSARARKVAESYGTYEEQTRALADYFLTVRNMVIPPRSDWTGGRSLRLETPWFTFSVGNRIHKKNGTYGWGVVFRRFESEAVVFADDRELARNAILDCITEQLDSLRTIGDAKGAEELDFLAATVEELEWPS